MKTVVCRKHASADVLAAGYRHPPVRSCSGRAHRGCHGQALVEGVVALVLIIAATTLGTLLLVNSGVCAYYKQKLAVVSNLAANFAANQPDDSDRNGPTKEYVCGKLKDLGFGLGPADVDVDVPPAGDDGSQLATVTLHNLPLVGNFFGFLPEIKDTGLACGSGQIAGYVKSSLSFHDDHMWRNGIGVLSSDRRDIDVYVAVLKKPKGKDYGHLVTRQIGDSGSGYGLDGNAPGPGMAPVVWAN
jgi:hypothetical protein